ncbi:hypothetical protein FA13DRAFT_1792943 [Coprinellus micaceus]|uniref:Uncharacterized protein n=1 Tax=Coprinellus micaceus TaxID=71717 RepID=A0A4Y7T625_COPMI|nr:hypothetical protein FA13DRAFT_1792943 [Coprinellus micaceus]
MPGDYSKKKRRSLSYSPYKSRGWGLPFKFDFPRKTGRCWDESTWRNSEIPEDELIKKSDAEYWPFKVEKYDGPSKGSKKDQKLYREVDIERIAWRKYGGPFHFERLLLVARHNHFFPEDPFDRFPPRYSHVLGSEDPM